MYASVKAIRNTCNEMGRNINTNTRNNKSHRLRTVIRAEERKEKRNELAMFYERTKRTVKVLV